MLFFTVTQGFGALSGDSCGRTEWWDPAGKALAEACEGKLLRRS